MNLVTRRNKHLILILLCMVPCLLFVRPVVAAEPFELHLIDVGQGQSVLIKVDGHYMLIDGGGRDASSFVVSYLKEQNVNTLDVVAASHYDEDHMAGLIGVLSVFDTDTLLLPDYAGEGDLYQSFAVAALSNGCEIMHPLAGWEFALGNADVSVIGPLNFYEQENDRSLCIRISYGETSFLICGDAEQQSEKDLAEGSVDLHSDVYIVNHHGSRSSSTDLFLDTVSPEYAMISCGSGNSYGHPAMETLQRLQNHGIEMFRTDKQGSVIVYSDGEKVWFSVDPCEEWTSGDGVMQLDGVDAAFSGTRLLPEADSESDIQEPEKMYRYVCNISSKKFHYPYCDSVKKMKEQNKLYTDLDREELIAQGYVPCGNCKP